LRVVSRKRHQTPDLRSKRQQEVPEGSRLFGRNVLASIAVTAMQLPEPCHSDVLKCPLGATKGSHPRRPQPSSHPGRRPRYCLCLEMLGTCDRGEKRVIGASLLNAPFSKGSCTAGARFRLSVLKSKRPGEGKTFIDENNHLPDPRSPAYSRTSTPIPSA